MYCTLQIHPLKSGNKSNRKNVVFWKLQRNDLSDVADLRIRGRFQFFTANPQMFALRNRFANPHIKTMSPKFADLRTGLRKCPALAVRYQQRYLSLSTVTASFVENQALCAGLTAPFNARSAFSCILFESLSLGWRLYIIVSCLSQEHNDTLPVRESNRDSATFQSLTRRPNQLSYRRRHQQLP